LNKKILVLDKNYQPIRIVNVRGAIYLVFREAANVIDEDYNVFELREWMRHSRHRHLIDKEFNVLRSVDNAFGIPDIIILRNFIQKRPRESVCTKMNVFMRDLYECQYCGLKMCNSDATLDHVVPRSRGGTITWYNAVASCKDCNNRKGHKTLVDSGMKLKKHPSALVWNHNYFRRYCMRYPNQVWEKFLGVKHG
jgi:5-methylcytosine-specific restriction endonuclease McrA